MGLCPPTGRGIVQAMADRVRHPFERPRAAALACAAGLALAAGPLHAQNADPSPPTQPPVQPIALPELGPEEYEGRTIAQLLLVAPDGSDPLRDATHQTARNNIRSYAGGPYDADSIASDIRRLNRVGLFSKVECNAQLLEKGQVRVVFELTEQPVVTDVQVTGNTKVTDRELADQVDLLVGTPVDRYQVDRVARRIENLYRDRGYYLARVTIDEDVLADTGVVLFRVREGERLRVTAIRFEGIHSVRENLVRRELETKTAGIFRKGALDDDDLDTDIANIINYYKDRGYLDVRAGREVQPAPNGREAIVTYLIEEGARYQLRDVKTQVTTDPAGTAPVFSPEQLAGLIGIKPGDAYGVQALNDAIETITNAYYKQGYADVRVERRELRDTDAPVVDLLLIISEGQQYTTGQVIIQGNEITKDSVIRREIEFYPGMPLDFTAVNQSRESLQKRRLFDGRETRITVQPANPIDPTIRDVLIEIKETNTGEISIGGAVSSDAGLIGRLAFEQRNFDVADVPDSMSDLLSGKSFRGAGQTFNIEALPGDRVQTFSIGLSDPALLDSDYSGSASVFFRNRDYSEFDERRLGTRLSLGRRFGTRWNGSVNARFESIELSDLDPSKPTDVFDVAEENLLTTIDLSLTRTSFDRFINPTQGSRTSLSVSQAGLLGGDFQYTKLAAEHTLYIALREDIYGRATTLKLNTEVAWAPQGPDEVPTYERYYRGGQSFRGLDFRAVSPKGVRNDNGLPSDDSIGGTYLFFAGAEINQPLFEEILSGVLFIDSGTVIDDPGFDAYRVTFGFGLRLTVPALSPAPLAFDFGWPLLKEDTDETRVFSFTLDVPF